MKDSVIDKTGDHDGGVADNGQAGPSTDWRRTKYNEVFEGTLSLLAYRRARESGFDVADAERILGHQYVSEGNDWGGRGDLGDIIMSATIAAHEHFIAEWKRENRTASEEKS